MTKQLTTKDLCPVCQKRARERMKLIMRARRAEAKKILEKIKAEK